MLDTVEVLVLGFVLIAGGAAWLTASGWPVVIVGVLLVVFALAVAVDA